MRTRILYVDDSGHHSTGWVVFGWVEVLLDQWKDTLAHWLTFRRQLYVSPGIPASYELHSSDFVSGRGNPTGRADWDRRKALRRRAVEQALDVIASCTTAFVGSARRRVRHDHATFAVDRLEAYSELVHLWDQQARHALVAYASYMDAAQRPEKDFAWAWYERVISRDTNHGPLHL